MASHEIRNSSSGLQVGCNFWVNHRKSNFPKESVTYAGRQYSRADKYSQNKASHLLVGRGENVYRLCNLQRFFTLMAFVCLFTFAQMAAGSVIGSSSPDYLVETWDTDSGLPHSTVTSIAQ